MSTNLDSQNVTQEKMDVDSNPLSDNGEFPQEVGNKSNDSNPKIYADDEGYLSPEGLSPTSVKSDDSSKQDHVDEEHQQSPMYQHKLQKTHTEQSSMEQQQNHVYQHQQQEGQVDQLSIEQQQSHEEQFYMEQQQSPLDFSQPQQSQVAQQHSYMEQQESPIDFSQQQLKDEQVNLHQSSSTPLPQQSIAPAQQQPYDLSSRQPPIGTEYQKQHYTPSQGYSQGKTYKIYIP